MLLNTKDYLCPILDTAASLLLYVLLLAADPPKGLSHRGMT